MILWGKEHEERAKALAASNGEAAAAVESLPRSNHGIEATQSGDATLTVWGHGDSTYFSEMLDVEFGQLITNWKTKNGNLQTVEIVTCDARHNQDYLAGYAKRVASFVANKTNQSVKLKALPVGQYKDDRSILWANSATKTFCYITSSDRSSFDHANQELRATEAKYNNDLGEVADAMAKGRTGISPNNYTTTGGAFKLIRNVLGIVQPSV